MTAGRYLFSERPAPVTVVGRECVIPYAPAAKWVEVVDTEWLLGIVPGMLTAGDQGEVALLMAAGEVSRADLESAALAVLAEVTGQPSQVAARLIASSADTITGQMLLRGLDPHYMTVGAWCAAAYALVMENRDEKSRMKVEMQLMLPLPGMSPMDVEGWDATEW